MGYQILKKPESGNLYNIFSSVSDRWVFSEPVSEGRLLEYFYKIEMAEMERRLELVKDQISKLKNGEETVIGFSHTWEEADRLSVHTTAHNNPENFPDCEYCCDSLNHGVSGAGR